MRLTLEPVISRMESVAAEKPATPSLIARKGGAAASDRIAEAEAGHTTDGSDGEGGRVETSH